MRFGCYESLGTLLFLLFSLLTRTFSAHEKARVLCGVFRKGKNFSRILTLTAQDVVVVVTVVVVFVAVVGIGTQKKTANWNRNQSNRKISPLWGWLVGWIALNSSYSFGSNCCACFLYWCYCCCWLLQYTVFPSGLAFFPRGCSRKICINQEEFQLFKLSTDFLDILDRLSPFFSLRR